MDRIVRFGPHRALVGILTGGCLPASAPTLVLPSAGLLPRAGPFRLHVEIARRLAPRGIRTFRFEVPGVGETPRLPGCGSNEATTAALDCLALDHGCGNFIVGGLCSAADVGWRTAVADTRVAGLLMIDGISFTGPWFHLARLGNLWQRPRHEWLSVLRRRLARAAAQAPALAMADYREWPARELAQQQFAGLVARGVRSLWIYTGGHRDCFLHQRQFGWSFGADAADPRVAMHYWPDCDHTFYARAHRDRLLAALDTWMTPVAGHAVAAWAPAPPASAELARAGA